MWFNLFIIKTSKIMTSGSNILYNETTQSAHPLNLPLMEIVMQHLKKWLI